MCVRKTGSGEYFFFSSRRRHTRSLCDWSSDVCSSDLARKCCLKPFPLPPSGPKVGAETASNSISSPSIASTSVRSRWESLPETSMEESAAEKSRLLNRSEERRVGKECRDRGSTEHEKE